MTNNQDKSSIAILTIAGVGVLSSLAVIFSIYLFFQRRQSDVYFVSQENQRFQEILAVKAIRRAIAEEFAGTVVNCLSPPLLPGQDSTERQVDERVTLAMEKIAVTSGNNNDGCANPKHPHWTFELPCKLKINSSYYKLWPALKLGDMNICKNSIVISIRSAVRSCTSPIGFQACLIAAILANGDLKMEIDKDVEMAPITYQ